MAGFNILRVDYHAGGLWNRLFLFAKHFLLKLVIYLKPFSLVFGYLEKNQHKDRLEILFANDILREITDKFFRIEKQSRRAILIRPLDSIGALIEF